MQHDGTLISHIALNLNSPELIQEAMLANAGTGSHHDSRELYTAPGTDTESWLGDLWAKTLQLGRISILDNFFELGGNSLQATQIIARAREHWQTDIALNAIFEHPTIQSLAADIDSCTRLDALAPAPRTLAKGNGEGMLSWAQQRLFFLHGWESEAATYNIPAAFHVTGELDPGLLEQCINELATRHETLRTLFTVTDNIPRQLTSDQARPSFSFEDLGELTGAEQEAACRSRLEQEARQAFDLEHGPLLRILCLRLNDKETQLLFTMHHIISDGWSLGILFGELSAMYNASRANKPALLPATDFQYQDYAHWQQQWLSGDHYASQLQYWTSTLAGELPLLSLPTDRPRLSVRSSRGAVCRFQIDTGLRDQLEALCREQGVTLFMGLLAAFYVLLSRYSQQHDIIIGTPVANRNHPGTGDLVGFFVNTLALRADLSDDPSFDQLLQRVKSISLDAFANQDVPFEKIVAELGLERNLDRTPVFQVMLVFQNAQHDTLKLSETVTRPIEIHTATSKFDLTLEVTQTDRGLGLVWEYDTALFDVETIEQLQHSFHTLLSGLRQQHTSTLSSLPVLDRQTLLELTKDTVLQATEETASEHLVSLFEAAVREQPDSSAVVFGTGHLSYAALNRHCNQLAHYLIDQGIGPGALVGLCLQRSIDLVTGIIGILKTGAAYVPLDPDYPQDRLAFMLEDAAVSAVVTQSDCAGLLHTGKRQAVLLDDDHAAIAACRDTNPDIEFSPQQLAYIIYTSGSTGQPKGVAIPHSNVIRLFSATAHWFHFDATDVWTLFHSCAFDFTVWELWGALLHGGKLVVVPFEITRSPQAFHDLLVHEQVTVLNQTPTAFGQLVRVDATSAVNPDSMSLRYIIFGGEALDVKMLRPWFDRHGDRQPRLVNMYGITETTVHVTWRPLSMADLDGVTNSAIGIPIPDLQCVVLDRHGQPVPPGVAGELLVGGAGLARGYLNRPGLTAQRFIANPWRRHGQRLYRTGDRVRKLRDGSLDYLGRLDHQVQLRGFRIELGEIEAALSGHPDVREALVLTRDDDAGEARLLAYLITAKAVSVSELRHHLQGKLPGYMIPAAFILLESFPLTANGKLDRKALPDPGHTRPGLAHDYAEPQTQTEKALADIWQQVLNIDHVGIHDSFFALGGDSIKSIPALAGAREQGFNITLLQLFQEQTIAGLARIIDADGQPAEELTEDPPVLPLGLISEHDRHLLPADVEDAYPLSMLQAGMLFHIARSPDSGIYHNVTSSTLQLDFSLDLFREAVRRTVARHDILRTSFDLTRYSIPLQLVHKTVAVEVAYEDISQLPGSEQRTRVDSWLETEKQRTFDISKAPLLRFHIHKLSARQIRFTITECHVLLDGWSENSTLAELWELHFSLQADSQTPVQPPPARSFRDFIALEQQLVRQQTFRAFWEQELAGFDFTPLPRWPDRYRSKQLSPVCSAPLQLPAGLSGRLRQLAARLELPLKNILLAAHLKVIATLLGSRTVTSGLVTHGRLDIRDGENIRGLFLNTLPFRMTLDGGSWTALIRDVFDKDRALFPSRRYPMAQIKKDCHQQQLFEAAFGYVHFHVTETLYRSGKLRRSGEVDRWTPTDFPLMTVFLHDPLTDQLAITLDYDQAVLCHQQITAIGQYYLATLAHITEHPDARYETFCPLPADEQRQIINYRNATSRPYPHKTTVHQVFDQLAHRQPGAVALMEADTELSYAGLLGNSNRLANYLIDKGCLPGDRIGVCLQRSVQCVTAILAILKAGGTYVPLDPDYPAERLEFMLHDTGTAIILTDQAMAAKLPESNARLVRLDRVEDEVAGCSDTPPAITSCQDSLAYIMYTSGSTGTPKGICIPHKAILRLVLNTDYVELGAGHTLMLLAPISFDASTFEIWGSLLTGARLAIATASRPSLADIGHMTGRYQVTTLWLTAGLFHQIVEENLSALAPVRQLLSGGDVLSVTHTRKVLENLPDCRLINGYGPTEGTTFTCCHTITPDDLSAASVPIGRPISNTRVYILDPALNPVPVGTPGELYIGGDGLAHGYLDRPSLTAERFIPAPFDEQDGARLYRTGDLVRMQPDGNINFIGRIDQQLKVRGYRIEPGEIENRLVQYPPIREAVVISRQGPAGSKQLIAYFTRNNGVNIDSDDIRKHLAVTLPAYMIPVAFVAIEEIPLTPNGKIDRQRLPVPDLSQHHKGSARQPPASEHERLVAGIWEEVLGIRQPGIHDNFFELGGDSLSATRLVSRIQQTTNVSLSLDTLFDNPTIAAIAAAIISKDSDREEIEI